VILLYYIPNKFSFSRVPQLMMIGAQGDEIPSVIVGVIPIEVVHLNN
jgi:hypothetical protein